MWIEMFCRRYRSHTQRKAVALLFGNSQALGVIGFYRSGFVQFVFDTDGMVEGIVGVVVVEGAVWAKPAAHAPKGIVGEVVGAAARFCDRFSLAVAVIGDRCRLFIGWGVGLGEAFEATKRIPFPGSDHVALLLTAHVDHFDAFGFFRLDRYRGCPRVGWSRRESSSFHHVFLGREHSYRWLYDPFRVDADNARSPFTAGVEHLVVVLDPSRNSEGVDRLDKVAARIVDVLCDRVLAISLVFFPRALYSYWTEAWRSPERECVVSWMTRSLLSIGVLRWRRRLRLSRWSFYRGARGYRKRSPSIEVPFVLRISLPAKS